MVSLSVASSPDPGKLVLSLRALALAGRFAESDSGGQIAALRELEYLSYKEMRRFIVAHKRARFLL